MEIKQGFGVSAGYAIGEAFVFDREQFRISRRPVPEKEVEGEVQRLGKALESAVTDTQAQIEALPRKIRDVASILDAQIRHLQNPVLREEITGEIRKSRFTAEYAASRTIRRKIKALEDAGNAYFAQRAVPELAEMERAVLRNLLGAKREDVSHLTGRVVIVAHDLSPAQTISLDRSKVLGLLTEVGSYTSHTSIVAKSLGIPAVVGAEDVTNDISGGDTVILDGFTGRVIINPDEATLKRYEALSRNFVLQEERLTRELRDLPAVTRDGTKVEVFANIESPDEIQAALDHGAEGIGLYRTEYLFLAYGFHPDERQHLDAYRKAVGLMGKRRLVIRTVDLGADKMPIDGLPREDNPFLGTRAIRLCFEQPEMFKVQLRAILKAASTGNVGLMIPMISSLSEVRAAREVVESVREELRREGEPAGDGMQFGIMIEVPSAAVVADMLAPHVDFLSIGTNDLIAYSVAVDRKNERVAPLYQPAHPAILRLLKQVIDAGAKHGKSVSVCGEMSSDVNFTLLLLGLGLRNFSAVPLIIPELKKLIRAVSIDEAKAVAEKAMTFDDARETLEYLKGETRKYLPEMS
jgi:phosphotransferase system enzyme I (PtsI)